MGGFGHGMPQIPPHYLNLHGSVSKYSQKSNKRCHSFTAFRTSSEERSLRRRISFLAETRSFASLRACPEQREGMTSSRNYVTVLSCNALEKRLQFNLLPQPANYTGVHRDLPKNLSEKLCSLWLCGEFFHQAHLWFPPLPDKFRPPLHFTSSVFITRA